MVLENFDQFDNIWVINVCQDIYLVLKAELILLAEEFLRYHFDCHLFACSLVRRAFHRRKSANSKVSPLELVEII